MLTLPLAACAEPEPTGTAPPVETTSAPLVSPGWERVPGSWGLLPTTGVVGVAANGAVAGNTARLWGRSGTTLQSILRTEGAGWGQIWSTYGTAFPAGVTPDKGIAAILRDDGVTNLAFHASNNSFYQTYYDSTVAAFADALGQGYDDPAWSAVGGTVHMWVRGLGSTLWMRRYAGGWENWRSLGGLPSGGTLASGPSAASLPGTSNVTVAVKSAGGDHPGENYVATWNDSTQTLGGWGWNGTPTGGTTAAPAVAGRISVPGGTPGDSVFVNASGKISRKQDLGWDFATSQDGSLSTLTTASGPPSAAYVGYTSGTGTHVAVVASDGYAYWRRYYTYNPPVTITPSSPRAPRINDVSPGGTSLIYGCEGVQFENTAAVARAGQAGCTTDKVLLSPGVGIDGASVSAVAAGDVSCFRATTAGVAGAAADCAWGAGGGTAAGSVPRCASPTGNAWTSAPAGVLGALGSNDTAVQLWGRTAPKLFAVRQGYAGDAPTRGTSALFESTTCGQSFTYRGKIDVCDASQVWPAEVCAPTLGGTDHPQISARTSTAGYAYFGVYVPASAAKTKRPVFRVRVSDLNPAFARAPLAGDTRGVRIDGNLEGCRQPTRPIVVGDRVILGCLSLPQAYAFLYDETAQTYAPATELGALISGTDAVEDWHPYYAWAIGAPIGVSAGRPYFRYAYPVAEGAVGSYRRQVWRLVTARFDGGTLQVIATATVAASSATGSVLWPAFVTPNESDTQGQTTTIGMMYWYESTTTSQAPSGESSAD